MEDTRITLTHPLELIAGIPASWQVIGLLNYLLLKGTHVHVPLRHLIGKRWVDARRSWKHQGIWWYFDALQK